MDKKYILSKDLTTIFATLFLGTSIFHSLTDRKPVALVFMLSTFIPTLAGICYMVIFRNKE